MTPIWIAPELLDRLTTAAGTVFVLPADGADAQTEAAVEVVRRLGDGVLALIVARDEETHVPEGAELVLVADVEPAGKGLTEIEHGIVVPFSAAVLAGGGPHAGLEEVLCALEAAFAGGPNGDELLLVKAGRAAAPLEIERALLRAQARSCEEARATVARQLAETQAELADLRPAYQRLMNVAERLETEADELRTSFDEVKATRGWRILQRWWRIGYHARGTIRRGGKLR